MKESLSETEKQLLFVSRKYEQKLIELMGERAFIRFSIALAKEMFLESINSIEDTVFRNFCLDNFEQITNTADCAGLDFPNTSVDSEDSDDSEEPTSNK